MSALDCIAPPREARVSLSATKLLFPARPQPAHVCAKMTETRCGVARRQKNIVGKKRKQMRGLAAAWRGVAKPNVVALLAMTRNLIEIRAKR